LYCPDKEAYIPVAEELGRLLYLMARATSVRTIVEFRTSFGISTIYLVFALRDNGGGNLITCEIEAAKSARAHRVKTVFPRLSFYDPSEGYYEIRCKLEQDWSEAPAPKGLYVLSTLRRSNKAS
jgi:hypothetical protein